MGGLGACLVRSGVAAAFLMVQSVRMWNLNGAWVKETLKFRCEFRQIHANSTCPFPTAVLELCPPRLGVSFLVGPKPLGIGFQWFSISDQSLGCRCTGCMMIN